jgi:PPOX class probable F420-dependent enzyme
VIDELSPAARELLESAAVATVATINADGSVHLSSAWVGIEDGEIVFATLPDQRKLRNLRRDPRIALSIHGEHVNEWGLPPPGYVTHVRVERVRGIGRWLRSDP